MAFEVFFDEVRKYALGDVEDVVPEYYAARMNMLYSAVLEEAEESEGREQLEKLMENIREFERSQRASTLFLIDEFEAPNPDLALEAFSSVAYGLAVEHIRGNPYEELAGAMRDVYEVLISPEEGFIPEDVMHENRRTVSETILDFIFASGKTDVMSMRMREQWELYGDS